MNARGLLAGALLALTLGWPVGGGLWALTWPIVRDGYSPPDAAARRLLVMNAAIVDETFPHGGDPAVRTPDCLDMIEQRGLTREGGIADVDLAGAIHAMKGRRDRADAEQVALESLQDLRWPVLGVLDGCVGGSLLAPLCSSWVAGRLRAALAAAQPKLEQGRQSSAAYASEVGCRAWNGSAQPSR